MPIPPPPEMTLEMLRVAIVARFPELAQSRFTLLTEGWDSVGVDIDGQWICKFARNADAALALRREVLFLDLIRPAVYLPVPESVLHEGEIIFTRHRKLAGEHLLAGDYERLTSSQRERLGATLGKFYAQLHSLDPGPFCAAGADDIYDWVDPEGLLQRALPYLDDQLATSARRLVADYLALAPDPYGTVFGYFDGHGWNMAFDHAAGCLNGVYDFGDAGFGALHREFVYGNFISPDLTARTIAAYETHTGRAIDRERVHVLTGMLRLWELAGEAGTDNVPIMRDSFARWAAAERQ